MKSPVRERPLTPAPPIRRPVLGRVGYETWEACADLRGLRDLHRRPGLTYRTHREVNWNASTSTKPWSVSFRLGMTSKAMKLMPMKGSCKGEPR